MKRTAAWFGMGLMLGTVMLALAADEPKPESFAQDFTKSLGRWSILKAEGKQDAEGVKITKVEEYGGIGIDDKPAQDLSSYKTADFDLVNGSDKEIHIMFKIGSGNLKRTVDEVALPPGAKTLSWKLEGGDVDLTKVDYMKIWVTEEGPVNLTVKKVTLSGGAAAATAPAATEPAK